MRGKQILALVLICCLVLAPGCGLARWGPGTDDVNYQSSYEYWEVPTGVVLFGPGLAVDLAITFTLGLVLGILNPLNWIRIVLGAGFNFPDLHVMVLTATTFTLINPSHNLDWRYPMPDEAVGFLEDDDDDDDDDDDVPHGEEPNPEDGY